MDNCIGRIFKGERYIQGRIIAESRIIKGHANRGEWKKIHVRAG